jgi:transketolase
MTAPSDPLSIDTLSINTLRTLAIDVIQKADSGHPGLPLGAAPMAYVLWQRHLKHCPTAPNFVDRDRFVLSAGHGSMLLYGLLHLTGYPLSFEEVLAFRQWGSKTPGHPEYHLTPGVEATTGPLGQGHANAVGMAMAERMLAWRFNRPGFELFNHFTYFLVGDGCVQEGVTAEAASLAGHLKLGKLIGLYDANDVTLDGPASLSMSEDVGRRYEAYGWQVLHVQQGDTDLEAIDAAITAAKAETSKPSLIIVKTTIGYGSPNKAGKSSSHGSPLGVDEIALTKHALGCDPEKKFFIPDEALTNYRQAVAKGAAVKEAWTVLFEGYRRSFTPTWRASSIGRWPASCRLTCVRRCPRSPLAQASRRGPPQAWRSMRWPSWCPSCAAATLTCRARPRPRSKTWAASMARPAPAATCTSGCASTPWPPSPTAWPTTVGCGPSPRPSSASATTCGRQCAGGDEPPAGGARVDHDSIGLGEDGPTHQPVEHLMAMRTIPNLAVVRPGDAAEAAEAWLFALERKDGPTGLVLSRQKVPTFDRSKLGAASGLHQGAYVLAEASGAAKALIIATGSEVGLAMAARDVLEQAGVPTRVVSMPCFEQFALQDAAYREAVLPAHLKARVSVEAGITQGWERWVGEHGISLGVDSFGASAPDKVLWERFGLTVGKVVEAVKRLL